MTSNKYRGLKKRLDRKKKHEGRAKSELKRLVKDRPAFKIWHWDKTNDEEVNYLIVEFNFTNKTTPQKFSKLLEEKLSEYL